MTAHERSRPSWAVVRLVARRELTTRVATKAFLVSTAVMIAVLVGGQVVYSVVSGGDDRATIATVGDDDLAAALRQAAKAVDQPVTVRQRGDADQVRGQVRSGDLDLAVIARDDGTFVAVSEDEIDAALDAVVRTSVRQVALDRALADQDVDTARLARDVAAARLTVDVQDPDDPDKGQRLALAYVAVLLLFFSIYLYGLYVAMGVVEEKASRVVELLLSTIRPIDLLVGKVLGIGAVGLLQVVVLGGTALAAGLATGLVTLGGTAAAVFVASAVWYVLGFAFFSVLYAGLGSLVSRQEDVNAATMPLSVLAFASYFAAQSAISSPDSTWADVLSWIPPFSAMLMPMRIAADVADPVQVVGSVVVMIVATVAAALFAARVYESSVLMTGGRRSLRSAVAGSR